MADQSYCIGYALLPENEKSSIQTSLIDHAKQHGINLTRIDPSKPLLDQGPFDCILHKLYNDEWKQQLKQFSVENPNVHIIDPPESIEQLHNRVSMLDVVKNMKISREIESLGIPKQTTVFDSQSLLDAAAIEELHFPIIAKPLVANSSDKSHKMKLVYNSEGLKALTTPIVLQEFINHGGIIFKVYVAGDHVNCVKRSSLPDIPYENSKKLNNWLSFSKVSDSPPEDQSEIERNEMPPWEFVMEIAKGLREGLGLHLFNFDLIRDGRESNRYLVIDINYFPGYAKMPSYESVFTQFLCDVVHKKKEEESLGFEEEDEPNGV